MHFTIDTRGGKLKSAGELGNLPAQHSLVQNDQDTIGVFHLSSSNSWYIDLSVHSLNCSLLVDSEAAATVINTSLYYDSPCPRPRLQEPKLKFRLADGRVTQPKDVMTCDIKIGDSVVEHQIYVADLGKINSVLGGDFLATGVKIDFGLGVLEYDGEVISLMNRSLAKVASVREMESFTIKANTTAKSLPRS